MSNLVIAGRYFIELDKQKNLKIIDNLNNTKRAIGLAKVINEMTKRSFQAFLEKDYERFDALCGENCCQIRAMLLLELEKKCEENPLLKNTMEETIEKIKQLDSTLNKINVRKIIPKPEEKITFESFLKENKIQLEIPAEIEFLLEAFILTITKVVDKHTNKETNYVDKIMESQKDISKGSAIEIIKASQRKLSEKSLQYLKKIAISNRDEILVDREDKYFERDLKGIQALPCFFGMKAIMRRLIREEFPIVLQFFQRKNIKENSFEDKLKKTVLFTIENKKFSKVKDISKVSNERLKKSALVIKGYYISKDEKPNIKAIEEFGLKNVILANAAQHAQYFTGREIDFEINFIKYRQKFENFKKLAEDKGYSESNPSIFCIDHISCQTIENVLRDIR